jgi:hypothetical protein
MEDVSEVLICYLQAIKKQYAAPAQGFENPVGLPSYWLALI